MATDMCLAAYERATDRLFSLEFINEIHGQKVQFLEVHIARWDVWVRAVCGDPESPDPAYDSPVYYARFDRLGDLVLSIENDAYDDFEWELAEDE